MSAATRSKRIWQLDASRGLIMVLMALDHANHFIAQRHSSGEYWGGPLPVYPNTLAFVTRLVTHLCAPGFFFLMGTGIELFADRRRRRGWSEGAVTAHFLLRGALLIGLQFLVVNRAWELSPGGWAPEIYAGVLFALGGAMMVVGGLLRRLPTWTLVGITLVLFLATELLTPDPSLWQRALPAVRRLLFLPGGGERLWVTYPLVPWISFVLAGTIFGRWLRRDEAAAFSRALSLGAGFLLAFLVVRAGNGFGNIRPRESDSWIDFLNVVKYPPSVSFALLTLGADLLLLGLLARLTGREGPLLQPLRAIGRVPLFFYVTHLFLYALLGRALTPNGTSISHMFGYWLLGLAMLYPACRWYGRVKRRSPRSPVLRLV